MKIISRSVISLAAFKQLRRIIRHRGGTLESSRIISKIVGCVERFWLSARQKLELCENGHPQKHPKMSKICCSQREKYLHRPTMVRNRRKRGKIASGAGENQENKTQLTSCKRRKFQRQSSVKSPVLLSRFGRMHKPHAVAYATAYEVG
ncbi:conserved hypothetical protein [Trichinella spiralis]|uniref:hypothetical protein n=1 Tax=Trichinella spiralis TaxID=6334 RepID=UPI0001EFCA4A|nr:conserved hypothetical protein [Trichinella spiralis]